MTPRTLNWKWIGAGISTLFALIVYSITMAPTLSFWDCGEFVSTAKILAVPHPPGAAIHAILGRVAMMWFVWFKDLSVRTNWISAWSGALTAGVAFLTAFRAIQMFQAKSEHKPYYGFAVLGGFLSAAFVTFGDTFWFSAVETEMYCEAMLLTLLGIWMMLEWTDLRHTAWGDRLIVATVYLAFLATNFSLFSVMFLPIIGIWVVWVDPVKRSQWPLIVAGVLVMSIIYAAGNFLFISLGFLVVSAALWAFPIVSTRAAWKLSTMMVLSALLGWSIYIYIPIRSTLDPIIDEGDPEIRKPLVLGDESTYGNLQQRPGLKDIFDLDNWGEFKEYIERKQYGSENPLVRAMTRRSFVANQLFVHENMGYGGYLVAQFLPFKVGRDESIFGARVPSQIAAIGVDAVRQEDGVYSYTKAPRWLPKLAAQVALFLLVNIPLWWLMSWGWRREKVLAGFLACLYLFASFGILFYVNFADGTQPDTPDIRYYLQEKQAGKDVQYPDPVHMEVRERDYFFMPAYVLVGILYGMAMAMFLQKLRQEAPERSWKEQPKFVAWAVLICLSPTVAGFTNWHEHDRSKNWVPYDYSFNLLNSCQPNGILFTNGDNDTFPLWALQEVYGIRKDVRLVNLSLINTDWYIRQMRDIEPKVPVLMSDAAIKGLQPEPNRVPEGSVLDIGGRQILFPSPKELPYIKVQDKMVLHIIMANARQPHPKPVHFAATVGEDNMMGLARYARMEGLVFTLQDSIQTDPVNLDRTLDLFDKVYKFRGLAGDEYSSGYVDDDTRRLLTNYASLAIQAAMGSAETLRRWNEAIKGIPDSGASAADLARKAELKAKLADRQSKIEHLLKRTQELLPEEWRTPYFESQLYSQLGRESSAESVLMVARKRMPNEVMLPRAQAELAMRSGNKEKALLILDSAAKRQPGDAELLQSLAMLQAETGKEAQALQTISAALALRPSDARLQNMKQMLEQHIGQAPQPALPPPAPPAPAESTAKK